jgi:hypothetical protein
LAALALATLRWTARMWRILACSMRLARGFALAKGLQPQLEQALVLVLEPALEMVQETAQVLRDEECALVHADLRRQKTIG